MEIDPSDQQLVATDALFAWDNLIDNKILIQSLRRHILPKWLKTLQEWLE
jgi:hypothetical protein